jgi:hypothetical protein
MKNVILHIGMHKTGTTSLQQSLRGFSGSGVRYVDLGPANHSIPVRAAFVQRTDAAMLRILNLRNPGELAALRRHTLARLEQELSLPGFDRFLISGEGIALLPPASVAALRDLLLKYVGNVQVCAYVREPLGFSASALQEHVKGGHTVDKVPQPRYRSKFAKFIDVFGVDHFSARVFAKERLLDGSVVADFCNLWGIPFDPRNEVRRNESLSEEAMKLLHLFNRSHPALHERTTSQWARPAMLEAIANHFPGTFRLPPEFAPQAADPQDLAWLRSHCGIDFAAPGVAGHRIEPGAFQRYLERIEPQVIASYRELLAQLGIPVRPGQAPEDLLDSHYRACERSLPVRWKAVKALFSLRS